MRFHDTFDDILDSTVSIRVLRALNRSRSREFTGRELARHIGYSASQTIATLVRLETSGVVERRIVGPAHTWKLSQAHALTRVLRSLFSEEARLEEGLRVDLAKALKSLPVEQAWLFGSVAKGDERPTSDIDILVTVRSKVDKKRVEEALSSLSSDFAMKFGNPLSVLVSVGPTDSAVPTSLVQRIRTDGIEIGV